MLNVIDKELAGVAMVFDDPFQMTEFALVSADESEKNRTKVREFMVKAHPDRNAQVQACVEELGDLVDFEPPTRKRRRVWSEVNGSIDIDRGLEGESAFYRRSENRPHRGPTNITITVNLDGNADESDMTVFYRGAMTVALSTILEGLGFNVEVVSWNVGERVYYPPYENQFTACKLKESACELDVNNMMNCLTGYFMRAVMFETFKGPVAPARFYAYGGVNPDLGRWAKYFELSNEHVIEIPLLRTMEECIEVTKKELKRLQGLC